MTVAVCWVRTDIGCVGGAQRCDVGKLDEVLGQVRPEGDELAHAQRNPVQVGIRPLRRPVPR